MSRDSLRRVFRTFLIAFLGIAVPGALSWLNALTEWARDEGQAPFPDARSLAFLGIAAISAGFIALLNLIVVGIEDASGKGFLRNVPPPQPRGQRGEAKTDTTVLPIILVSLVAAAGYLIAVLLL